MHEIIETRYATLHQLSKETGITVGSLRVKLTFATQRGIALPTRRRIGKAFLYDRQAFMQWLWDNADDIRRPAPTFTSKPE